MDKGGELKIAGRKVKLTNLDNGEFSLSAYKAKRDFHQTREPAPRIAKERSEAKKRLFVIQKHAASHLHYDFRLEMEGVLKSWAVPKGPPYERNEKRLAMQVEDHPFEYARFEGTIPPGNYGAGTVMVWDIGTYEVMDGNLYAGKLHLRLSGKKLKGEWILVQTDRDDKRTWFLIKGGTSMERLSARRDDSSALTRRSLAKIAKANDAQWISHRQAAGPSPERPDPALLPVRTKGELKSLPKAQAKFAEPMQALLTSRLPKGGSWLYELKFDGYRAIAVKRGEKVELRSRNDRVLNYPQVKEALERLPVDSAVLDGEIVALDSAGKQSFQALQGRSLPAHRIQYYLFDLLNFDGVDVRSLALEKRKEWLQGLAQSLGDPIHLSGALAVSDPDELLAILQQEGMEGIVAKKRDSRYECGERSGSWLKFRIGCEQEFVVGGFRHGQHAEDFDALLVGVYQGRKLRYAGKVKDGFTPRERQIVLRAARPLARKKPPFSELPIGQGGRWGEGLTEEDLKRITWLAPKLVIQVQFVEWTSNGMLRHPKFKGVRQDKKPSDVVREVAAG